jgi:hypothetical protein
MTSPSLCVGYALTTSCTVGAEEFHIESSGNIPEGKAMLRYAFEPTGKPDIAEGKGTPGCGQSYLIGLLPVIQSAAGLRR